MFRAEVRQPLLPARQRQRQPARRAARQHGRRALAPTVLAASGAMAFVLVLLLLYRRAPQPKQDAASSDQVQHDAHAQLDLLRQPPSPHFCTLPPPLVCAHGGDVSAAPPNTAAAFAAALDGGAQCVEVDVARTRDGQLVVLHARELAHLLHLAGWQAPWLAGQQQRRRRWRRALAWLISRGSSSSSSKGQRPLPQAGEFSWEQLRQLRWEGGQQVELAESVVRLVQQRAKHITLDMKTHEQGGRELDAEQLAEQVVELVQRTACSQCLVWAKSDQLVRLVQQLAPTQPVGYIVFNETAEARTAGMNRLHRLPDAAVCGLHHQMATAEVTEQLRAHKQRVHAWTADTPSMMRAVLDAGVDAVVTSHPSLLQQAIHWGLAACRWQCQARADSMAGARGLPAKAAGQPLNAQQQKATKQEAGSLPGCQLQVSEADARL